MNKFLASGVREENGAQILESERLSEYNHIQAL